MLSLVILILAITASVGVTSESPAPIRVLFLPTLCDVRTHTLIEGFVLVENLGRDDLRVPVDLELGHGYTRCMIRRGDGNEDSCMGDMATSWPAAPDSVITIPPGGAYARRTRFFGVNDAGALDLGVTLCLPPDVTRNAPRQAIRSEWTRVTVRARE
jgi:hypothetical protein